MLDDKKKTEWIGWAGFIILLGGGLAVALPGTTDSMVVLLGFLFLDVGGCNHSYIFGQEVQRKT